GFEQQWTTPLTTHYSLLTTNLKMKKLLLTLVSVLSITAAINAQNTGQVRGTVWDEANQVLPFSNVFLLSGSDSSMVKAALADEQGTFTFGVRSYGSYIVSVSMVGYGKLLTPRVVISQENPLVRLEKLVLKSSAQVLKDVTVTAKKPLLEQHADKLVMN